MTTVNEWYTYARMVKTTRQRQTAVTAYFSSEHLLLFVFVRQDRCNYLWCYISFSRIIRPEVVNGGRLSTDRRLIDSVFVDNKAVLLSLPRNHMIDPLDAAAIKLPS